MTTGDDQVRVDNELKRLRSSDAGLAVRVQALENFLWRTGVVVGVAALVLGLVIPFLVANDDGELDSITLLGMVFASKADADDGGPFSGEANLLSFLLGLLALGTVIVIGVLLTVAARRISRRGLAICRFLAVLYLVGALGTWLVVLVLAGQADDGVVYWLSPATVLLTIGASVAAVMTTKGADLIDIAR